MLGDGWLERLGDKMPALDDNKDLDSLPLWLLAVLAIILWLFDRDVEEPDDHRGDAAAAQGVAVGRKGSRGARETEPAAPEETRLAG